jgi:hypothetical protein
LRGKNWSSPSYIIVIFIRLTIIHIGGFAGASVHGHRGGVAAYYQGEEEKDGGSMWCSPGKKAQLGARWQRRPRWWTRSRARGAGDAVARVSWTFTTGSQTRCRPSLLRRDCTLSMDEVEHSTAHWLHEAVEVARWWSCPAHLQDNGGTHCKSTWICTCPLWLQIL